MALTETKVVDKIEVLENGIVQVREVTRIMKDNAEIAHTYHRWVLAPEADLTGQPVNVVAICNAAWTPEVIAAYKAQQEANKPAVAEAPAAE
jgi:hypothetical protein